MFVEHKEALEATEVPAKTLKLSEAIRIGARMGPQCRGNYIDGNASCVFGAAALAMGRDWIFARALHRDSRKPDIAFAMEHHYSIAEANDKHDWSREAIADWLEAQGY